MTDEENRYKKQRDELLAFVKSSKVESGICCCGEEMDWHSPDHIPVDRWVYTINCFAEEFAKSDADFLLMKNRIEL